MSLKNHNKEYTWLQFIDNCVVWKVKLPHDFGFRMNAASQMVAEGLGTCGMCSWNSIYSYVQFPSM